MSSTVHVFFFSSDVKTKLQNSDFYQYVWVCYLVKKKNKRRSGLRKARWTHVCDGYFFFVSYISHFIHQVFIFIICYIKVKYVLFINIQYLTGFN